MPEVCCLGFPTLIILDSRGQEVDRIEGAMRAKRLIEELQLIFKSAKSDGSVSSRQSAVVSRSNDDSCCRLPTNDSDYLTK